MARKTKEEALQTRSDIMDAAVRVFSERGVSRSTLADIAKEAGVTRGAIYWHFKNKYDLLEALWDMLFLPLEPIMSACQDGNEEKPLDRMGEALIAFFKILSNDPLRLQLFRILFAKCEVGEDTCSMHLHRTNCHRDGLKRFADIFANSIKKGQLPVGYDIRLAAIASISFIDGLTANWLMFPEMISVENDIPVLIHNMIGMLRYGFPSRTVA